MFLIISKHFWVAALAVAGLNTAITAARSQRFIEMDPGLRDGYRTMLRHYFVWSTLPWVIVGAGIVVGGVPTIFHFFQPRHGDPFVLAFHGLVIVVWCLLLYWVFVRDGAEMLIRYPGFLSPGMRQPWMIKGFIALAVTGGVIAEVVMWSVDFPIGELVEKL